MGGKGNITTGTNQLCALSGSKCHSMEPKKYCLWFSFSYFSIAAHELKLNVIKDRPHVATEKSAKQNWNADFCNMSVPQ
jgi:hypothetical protein